MSMEDLFGSDIESEEEDSNDVQADSYEGLQSTQAQMQDLFGDSPEADANQDANHQEESEAEEEEEEEEEEEDEDGHDQQQEEESNEGYEDESGPTEAGPSRDEEEGEDDEQHYPGDNRDESNDDTAEHTAKPTQEDLFGEELDVSSDEEKDDDEKSPVAPIPEELDDLDQFEVKEKEAETVEEGQEEEPVEEEGHVINIELPRLDATIGKELYFVKLPNFLSIETKPFDPNFYEDEIDDDEVLDEEGRARLKLKVENTVRWRNGVDKDGNEIRESNARVVRWSDGSLSLHLGNEIFDIFKMKIQGEQNHLFVQQGTGLQSRAVFKEKLNFRPHSTMSQTHRKMTMSIADRMSKAQKIRVVPAFERDPESQRQEMIKKEEERVRAMLRRESQQRRIRERSHAKGLTPAYLEGDYEDGDEQELEESLAAIKNKYKKELTGKGDSRDVEDVYSNDESDGDEKLMNAKADISSEEEGPRGSKRRANDELTRKKKSVKKIIEDSDEDED